MARPMPSATARTWRRSAEPSSSCGVPTAMKRMSLCWTAAGEVGGEAEALLAPRCAGSSRPGPARRWGSRRARRASTLSSSLSTQTTVLPFSARQAPTTRPDVARPDHPDLQAALLPATATRRARRARAERSASTSAGLAIIPLDPHELRPRPQTFALEADRGRARTCWPWPSACPRWRPHDRFFFFSASLRTATRDRDLAGERDAWWTAACPCAALNFAWNRLEWPPLDRLVGAHPRPRPLAPPAAHPGQARPSTIVTIHDLFFLKHPDMTEAEIRRDYVPLVREHVRRADGVICVSEHTASEARLLLDVPAGQDRGHPATASIPPTALPIAAEAVDAVLARRRLPRGALLYVGQRGEAEEPRQPGHGLHGPGRGAGGASPPLRAGGPGLGMGAGRRRHRGPQIRATGYLETREIRALMAASAALVLPSLEEGFGLPVVEAMAAGLPVVCSRGSALEEVAGDAATLVNPLDTRSIADGIEKILDDPRARPTQRAHGPRAEPRLRLGHRRRADPRVLPAGAECLIRRAHDRHRRARAAGTAHGDRPLPAQPAARLVRAPAATGCSSTSTGRAPDDPVLGSPGVVPRAAGRRARRAASGGRSARLPAAARADGVDVFFCPRLHLPARPATCPRVTAVHDLSFFSCARRLRRCSTASAGALLVGGEHARLARACSPAPTSRGARSRRCFPDLAARVVHVPLGADDDLPPPPAARRGARARWACAGPLILTVGAILNRRRLPDAAARRRRACAARWPGPDARGRGREPHAARRSTSSALVADAGLDGRGPPRPASSTTRRWPLRYAAADVAVFLSEYEGFGLPALEAMARGVPVVASRRPALGEIFGEAALLVEPARRAGGGATRSTACSRRRRCAPTSSRRGRALAARFSWAETARAHAWRCLADGGGRARERAPRVTVVVVSYNTRDDLLRCLAALRGARRACPSKSSWWTTPAPTARRTRCARAFPTAVVIANAANLGFSRANNRACARRAGAYVLILNSDAEVAAGRASRRWPASSTRAPDVGIVGPRTVGAGRRASRSRSARRSRRSREWRQRRLVRGVQPRRPGGAARGRGAGRARARAGLGLRLLPAGAPRGARRRGRLRRGLLPL